ncbi:MAG: cysteine hydrolase family protein [Caldilineaceae bacterium]
MRETALLIIDVQAGMFMEAEQPCEGTQMLANINHLLAEARASETPVIYVQHGSPVGSSLEPGTPGWQIHAAIAPQPTEPVVRKRYPDSFQETNLQEVLTERGIKKLIIAGMQTEFCVDTTCRRAASLGYDVTLVQDAHSTFGNGILPAAKIIAHHNAVLGDSFARLQPTKDVAF